MVCNNCGKESMGNTPFCSGCGAAFTAQPMQPQATEPPAQPQYDYSQQQYGSQQPQQPYVQPQQPYVQPQTPGQLGYGQPPTPVKKKKKTMLIMLIVIGAVAIVTVISLLVLLPHSKVDIADPPESDTPEITGDVGEEDEEEINEDEGIIEDEEEEEEEQVEEEEEDNIEPDEPPFLTTLRTGVYGYVMHMVTSQDEWTIEDDCFVYSNGSLMAFGIIDSDGKLMSNRYIYDYEKKTIYGIFDDKKLYNFKEDIDFWHSYGIPDFYSGLDQSEKGTTEFDGETLDYIDCGSGEDAVRVLIKDGDVYVFQFINNDWASTFFLLQTYSSPPTAEYFEIPDDYELYSR